MAKYEARICKDMPADCCDYGVISFETGKEVCRVWLEEDARKIANLLNGAAPASAASEREHAKRAFLAGWMRYDTASDCDIHRAHTEFDAWWPEAKP